MKLEYYGCVTDGKLKIRKRIDFDNDLKRFEGVECIVTVEKYKAKRSNQQNRYYWKCVVEPVWQGLRDLSWDYSKEDAHNYLKANFNFDEIAMANDEVVRKIKSTARMTKGEFSEYIEKIARWAAENLNIEIKAAN